MVNEEGELLSQDATERLSEPRPRLIPVRVPWQVETFDPHLTLLVSETPVEPTEIMFYARVLKGRGSVALEQRVVRLTFRDARGGRVVPGENDMPFNPCAYDNSALPACEIAGEDPLGCQRALDEHWSESGICPDPSFYQVMPSPWMQELCLDDEGLKHYLAVGRHAVAEVLAEGWDWQFVEPRDSEARRA